MRLYFATDVLSLSDEQTNIKQGLETLNVLCVCVGEINSLTQVWFTRGQMRDGDEILHKEKQLTYSPPTVCVYHFMSD